MEVPAGAVGRDGVIPRRASILARALRQTLLAGVGLVLPAGRDQPGAPGRPRIAFQAYALHLAQFYRPVIERLRSEDVELCFIVLPHPELPPGETRALARYARQELRIARENVQPYWRCLWRRYDLVICNDVYARFPLRRAPRWLMWHGAGIPHRFVSESRLRKTVFDFDLLLTGGAHDAALVRSVGAQRGVDVETAAVGIPFLDRLADAGPSRAAYLESLSLDPRRKTLLFAPHWGPGSTAQAMSADHFAQCLAILADSGFNVVFKPHAWSYSSARPQVDDWERTIRRYPSIGIDRSHDDLPALHHADILVTDGSSRAFNFMLLDRPVILIFQPTFRERVDVDRARLMQRAALVANDPSELGDLLRQADADPAGLSDERRRVVSEAFVNYGCATEAAARLITGRTSVGFSEHDHGR